MMCRSGIIRSRAEPAGFRRRRPDSLRPGRRKEIVPVRRNHPEFHDPHARESVRRFVPAGPAPMAAAPRRLARPDRPVATGCSLRPQASPALPRRRPQPRRLFLKDNPRAVWVTTVPDCLACLAEPWYEVHLDHDLGGKIVRRQRRYGLRHGGHPLALQGAAAPPEEHPLLRAHAQRDRGAADGPADARAAATGPNSARSASTSSGSWRTTRRDRGPNLAGIGGSTVSSRCGSTGSIVATGLRLLGSWVRPGVPRSGA